MNDEVLTVREACAELKIGKTLAYQLMKDGELKRTKFRKKTVIMRSDLKAYIASVQAKAAV